MKKLLRQYFIFTVSIFAVAEVVPGISYSSDWLILAEASFLLTLSHLILRPIVNIVALPFNILTLGLFSFVINALMLFLVSRLLPDFRVTEFYFPNVNLSIMRINSFYVSPIFSYILVAFIISVVRNFFLWLCSK